ncbi:DUF2854 domain-containing protein [Lyngbya confervoides]|uniref:DUF2854 domain-containing protein n=1 Tax=Lyngbya confervoides BDU141951 TaxID=1574623 RepID=A0ABD4T7U4_9CYAN|nr:DUF2854 domain-containing protein [Lyngbya confervoides]MCM1984849.1 DUF2854 domain-containing protein [Lyngbya confervoides BDU141951]
MLTRFSLAKIGLIVGGILSVVGLIAYISGNATANLAGFFYGIPLFLGGLAFKIAELKPAPILKPTPEAVKQLREKEATPTQNQVRKDVTRYRYGQDIHLDVALARLGLCNKKEALPELTGIYEEDRHGHYALALEFNSPLVSVEKWQGQQEKIQSFFGPGITAEVEDLGEDRVRLALISAPEAAPASEDSVA